MTWRTLPWLAIVACDWPLFPHPVEDDACDSMHAARIALEHGLGDCHRAALEIDPTSWAARGDLTANPIDHPCAGQTANACARHFVDRPEDLLVPVQAQGQLDHHFFGTEAQCSDGTPPLVYYRPAPSADHEDDWVVYFHGTNLSCRAMVDRAEGTLTPPGEVCWANYGPGGSVHTSLRAPTELRKGGILNETPRNPFHGWNVVYLRQCSNDLSSGRTEEPTTLSGDPLQVGDLSTVVPFHGDQIVADMLAFFDGPDRPSPDHKLSDAGRVLLVGSSGGAMMLNTRLDRVAARVASHAPLADIRGVIDAHTEPSSLVLEAEFDDGTPCTSIYEADCDEDFDVPNTGVDQGTGMGFDSSAYEPFDNVIPAGQYAKGWVREQFEGWDSAVDASCAAYHTDPDDVHCYDQYHVLFHHTETPVFIVDSARDPGKLDRPPKHQSVNSPDECYVTLDPKDPTAGTLQYRQRHIAQAASYARNRDTPGGGAHGDSHGAGDIGVFVADWPRHMFLPDDCCANEMMLGPSPALSFTATGAIMHWLEGHEVVLIDGLDGVRLTQTASCGRSPVPRTCLTE